MASASATTLNELLTRSAITDTVSRAIESLDRANVSLFESAYTQDATFEVAGYTSTGLEAIRQNVWNHISKLDTTHFVTNIRIAHTEGESTAKGTANALAMHFREKHAQNDASHFLTGNLYDIEFKKEGNDWKISVMKMTIVWSQGDYSIVSPQ